MADDTDDLQRVAESIVDRALREVRDRASGDDDDARLTGRLHDAVEAALRWEGYQGSGGSGLTLRRADGAWTVSGTLELVSSSTMCLAPMALGLVGSVTWRDGGVVACRLGAM